MTAKEEKFWELLREEAPLFAALADALEQAMAGELAEATYQEIAHEVGKYPFTGERLLEKCAKAYKERHRQYAAERLLSGCESILSHGDKLLLLFLAVPMEKFPEAISLFLRLAAESLREWQKILIYTADVSANGLRIEARARKITNFRERSASAMLDSLRWVYRDAGADGLYWRDVISHLEEIIALTARNVQLLNGLLEE